MASTGAGAAKDRRWADDDEEEDDDDLNVVEGDQDPTSSSSDSKGFGGKGGVPASTSRMDDKGFKVITSYRPHPTNPNQLLKTVTRIRVHTDKVREHVDVEKRRKWKKFGQAASGDDQSNVTIQSRDDVYMEDPNADTDLQDEDVGKAIAGNLNAFWAKQQRRQLERIYGVEEDGGGDNAAAAGKPGGLAGLAAAAGGGGDEDGGGWKQVGADKTAAGGGVAKYVPPSQRGPAGAAGGAGGKSLSAMAERVDAGHSASGGAGGNRDQNTIRVTNISEDTTEADLQELFQPFGRISRVYLAKDKETMQSRGFAFVSFVHREDAQRAMDKLQGYGYDHLILKLEWARPSAPKDPGSETVFRSGYGKALAQDTKESVTFASNLTHGTR